MPAPAVEAPVLPSWSFRVTPYGWLMALNGTQTVRGRLAKVDASFADIVRESDTLMARMGEFEARTGPFSFYGDLVWSKIGLERGDIRTRAVAPGHELFLCGDLGGFGLRSDFSWQVIGAYGFDFDSYNGITSGDWLPRALRRLRAGRRPAALWVRHAPARAGARRQRSVLIARPCFRKPARTALGEHRL
ncbi:hypothetical protein [Microvirga tunisiensis]|uniref:hypothetical protein n=1 Tax=Microvirga tunisiensis TaxID=2108360 RepID=UPI001FCE5A11|nr:hypothetical protein [Microvirga tunisiensis]